MPSNSNSSAYIRLPASLWTRILMHHKGKGFPFYLFAKGINLNFTQDLGFFSLVLWHNCILQHSSRSTSKTYLIIKHYYSCYVKH